MGTFLFICLVEVLWLQGHHIEFYIIKRERINVFKKKKKAALKQTCSYF